MNPPEKRYRLEVGEFTQVQVVLVGCGGTGSFAALHLARLAWVMQSKGLSLNLVFIDGDRVEEGNIGRQNFCPAEVGEYKALALARRYSLAFGLKIRAIPEWFELNMLAMSYRRELGVLVGCVDTAEARQALHQAVTQSSFWWLDAGNDLHSGQVLLGNERETVIDAMGYATALPRPSVQEPDLMKANPPQSPLQGGGEGLSCAELLVQEAQSLMINQAMAGWLGVYLSRMLLSHDLDMMGTYLNLADGQARSVGITGEAGEVKVVEKRRARVALRGMVDATAWHDDELLEIADRTCPECGGDLAEGQEDVPDFGLEDIIFCPACEWLMLEEELEGALGEHLAVTAL